MLPDGSGLLMTKLGPGATRIYHDETQVLPSELQSETGPMISLKENLAARYRIINIQCLPEVFSAHRSSSSSFSPSLPT